MNDKADEPDVSRFSPLWTERFRDLNSLIHEVEPLDEKGEPMKGVVQGTMTWGTVELSTDSSQAALVLKFVPQGELDPHAEIPMHLNMVHPQDATDLWRAITDIMVCSQLRDELYAVVEAHHCEEGDNDL